VTEDDLAKWSMWLVLAAGARKNGAEKLGLTIVALKKRN
jgi:hypothetical protein